MDILDEIGEPNVEIAYDLYHLWDAPNAVEMAHKAGSRVGGVHVSDWREPPRSIGDRLIPEMGIPIAELCRALEDGGFEGWYELEIFSDLTSRAHSGRANRPPRPGAAELRTFHREARTKANSSPNSDVQAESSRGTLVPAYHKFGAAET